MRLTALIAMLPSVALAFQEQTDPVLLLAKVRAQVSEALRQTSDYTCLATMERSSGSTPRRSWKRVDLVRYEIASSGGREFFGWRGQTQFEETSAKAVLPYGVVSNGEYALHARAVFTDGYSTIRFAGPSTLNGQPAIRWNFVIPHFGSGWYVSYNGRRVRTGSHGSFWTNPATLDLLRIEMYADDLPADFGNTNVATWTEYGRVQLGSSRALLPHTAGVFLRERSGKQNLNLLEFSHCRQYTARSRIYFSPNENVSTAKSPRSAKRTAATEPELPPGLTLDLRLAAPILSTNAVVGDTVEAVSASDAVLRGAVAVPAGTVFYGRVRRTELREGNPPQFAVGLEFSELRLNGERIRFFGTLVSVTPEIKGLRQIKHRGVFEYRPSSNAVAQIYDLPDVPGVATLIFVGPSFEIPRGSIFTWRTGKLE